MPHPKPLIIAVLGSVRTHSYTRVALEIVLDEFRQRGGVALDVVDPRELAIPLPGLAESKPFEAALVERIRIADGMIFATPEYHGSYSSVIKLLIDQMGYPSILAGKPIGLLGVAAGQIGAVKALEHLRSVLAHVGAMVLPYPVSVAHVHRVFDSSGNCTDPALEKLIRGIATQILEYLHHHAGSYPSMEEVVRDAES